MAKQISSETKERIRQTAEELGYRPNVFARYLRSRRTKTIGAVLFDINDPYCTQVLQGLQTVLFEAGAYLPVVIDTQKSQPQFRRGVRMLMERQVDGMIVLANPFYREDEFMATIHECNIPVVMIGRKIDESISSVTVENAFGAQQAIEHLHAIGHREIAFIRGPKSLVDSRQRWDGMNEFARRVGLRIDSSLIVVLPQKLPHYEGGYEVTRELLGRNRRFTAVVAFDDMSAFGAIRALEQADVRVPSQCSVIGFDDIATSAYYNPPLTTVRQNMELLGSTGVEILLEGIAASARRETWTAVHRTVRPHLVLRQSTSPCAWSSRTMPVEHIPLPR